LVAKGHPTFDIVIEIISRMKWRIYSDVRRVIDAKLANKGYVVEVRNAIGDQFFGMTEEHKGDADNSWLENLVHMVSGLNIE
jgi:hypothetical protein